MLEFEKGNPVSAYDLTQLTALAKKGSASRGNATSTPSGSLPAESRRTVVPYEPLLPFLCSIAGVDTIRVQRGRLKYNGTDYDMDVDASKDYKTLTGLTSASATYYIYVEFEIATTTLTAKKDTSKPVEASGFLDFIIAEVTTDSDGVILDIVQRREGDLNDAAPGAFDWQVYNAIGKGTFELRTGIWQRNNTVVTYDGTLGTPIDPVLRGIIPLAYTGTVYVYAYLNDSHEPTQVKVLCSVAKLEYPGYVDPFKMQELIAELTYDTGAIIEIKQRQVAAIEDTCFLYSGEFGIKVTKSDYDKHEYTVRAGGVQRRNCFLAAGGVSNSDKASKAWYVQLNAYPGDPSLVPTAAVITLAAAQPVLASYQMRYYYLYDTDINEIEMSSSSSKKYRLPYCFTYHKGGTIFDDWVRPDGQDETENGISTTYPRGKTLGFVPAGTAHEGELEDFGFSAKVLNGNPMGGVSNDAIVPWYLFSSSASTEKFYARLDAPNNASHVVDSGKSIDMRTVSSYKVVEIYDFFLASGYSKPDSSDDFSNANADDGYFTVLARRKVGDERRVEYISLRDFKPDTAGTADNAAHADDADYADSAGSADSMPTDHFNGQADDWWGQKVINHTDLTFSGYGNIGAGKSGGNTDHDDSYWHAYNDSSGVTGHATYKDAKEYRTTGDVWTAQLHVDSAAGAVHDIQYWSDNALIANVAYTIEFVSGTTGVWKTADNTKSLSLGIATEKWGQIDSYSLGAINLYSGTTGQWTTADSTKTLSLGTATFSWGQIEAHSIGPINLYAKNDSVWAPTLTNSYDLSLGENGSIWEKINLYATDLYVNGSQGSTVANWFQKGIMVGTLTEITVGDGFLPTDKILVLR